MATGAQPVLWPEIGWPRGRAHKDIGIAGSAGKTASRRVLFIGILWVVAPSGFLEKSVLRDALWRWRLLRFTARHAKGRLACKQGLLRAA